MVHGALDGFSPQLQRFEASLVYCVDGGMERAVEETVYYA
jgi:hypothetical protein